MIYIYIYSLKVLDWSFKKIKLVNFMNRCGIMCNMLSVLCFLRVTWISVQVSEVMERGTCKDATHLQISLNLPLAKRWSVFLFKSSLDNPLIFATLTSVSSNLSLNVHIQGVPYFLAYKFMISVNPAWLMIHPECMLNMVHYKKLY